MDYFTNRDLGFKKDAIVSFFIPDGSKKDVLQQRLMSMPGVTSSTLSTGEPSFNSNFAPFSAPDRGLDKDDVTEIKLVDENYIDMFGLTMLAGKKVTRVNDTINRLSGAQEGVVVNETLIHKLGIQDPQKAIGVRFKGGGDDLTITGVVQDFQSESKHKARRPVIMAYAKKHFFRASARLESKGLRSTLASIESTWTSLFPNHLFNYEFLDDRIESFYQQEQKIVYGF